MERRKNKKKFDSYRWKICRLENKKGKKKKKPTKMNWSYSALLLGLSVWRAFRVCICVYIISVGRFDELLLLLWLAFLPFSQWGDFWTSSRPHLYLEFYRHGKGVPEIVPLLNLCARQRSALFIPPQFEPKEKNADRSKKNKKVKANRGRSSTRSCSYRVAEAKHKNKIIL